MTRATIRTNPDPALLSVRSAVRARRRFVVTSHARPDGDAIGSSLALAFALRALGKAVRVVSRDPAPPPFMGLPGVNDIELVETVTGDVDAAIVMECGSLDRTGLQGLDAYHVINIDHHLGNTGYGAVNWVDESAAACGELVYELIEALDVRLSLEMATHLYLAILTDTGGFQHSHITARTFEICRAAAAAGVEPAALARRVFASASTGRLRLIGAVLNAMVLDDSERVAVLDYDDALIRAMDCTADDTEGLINLPLSARTVQAVVLFKSVEGEVRVSLRSKGDVDVRSIAQRYGGGGHLNAAGFTATGALEDVRATVVVALRRAIADASHE